MADMDQTAATAPAVAGSMGAGAPAPMASAATAAPTASPVQVSSDRLERAKAALVKASASGNIEDAAQLAKFIREQEHIRNTPGAPGRSDAVEDVGVSGADSIAETVSGWFKPQDPKEQSISEIEGKLAGGAGAGAVGGALLPKALSLASKVAPNKFGLKSGLQAASEAAGKVPASKRIIGGAGGGAAAGGVDVAGESLGAPPAVTFAGELVAGGVGDTAATVLQKGTTQLLRSVANASVGNKAGALRALADIVKPDKALNAKEAARIQETIFGKKTEGYLDEAIRSDYRQAQYTQARQANPELSAIAARWAKETGDPEKVVAPASAIYRKQMNDAVDEVLSKNADAFNRARRSGGGQPVPPGTPVASEAGMIEGTTRKLPGGQTTQQQTIGATKPYSDAPIDGKFKLVGEHEAPETRPFSQTPAAQSFFNKLNVLVEKQEISRQQADGLIRAICTDTSPRAAVRSGYAETIDNRVRELFSTGHDATGARAISPQIERDLKGQLQSSFGDYVKNLTGKDLYRESKEAYTAEKLAEAKDKFPYFFKDQIDRKEFDNFASNLARDPAGKVFLQTELSRHLANVPPQQLVADFNKARSTLVKQGLVGPEDLQVMHQAVKRIAEVADEGLKLKFTEHLRNQLMLALARQPGAKAGGAVGKSRDEGSEWMVPGV